MARKELAETLTPQVTASVLFSESFKLVWLSRKRLLVPKGWKVSILTGSLSVAPGNDKQPQRHKEPGLREGELREELLVENCCPKTSLLWLTSEHISYDNTTMTAVVPDAF